MLGGGLGGFFVIHLLKVEFLLEGLETVLELDDLARVGTRGLGGEGFLEPGLILGFHAGLFRPELDEFLVFQLQLPLETSRRNGGATGGSGRRHALGSRLAGGDGRDRHRLAARGKDVGELLGQRSDEGHDGVEAVPHQGGLPVGGHPLNLPQLLLGGVVALQRAASIATGLEIVALLDETIGLNVLVIGAVGPRR